MRNPSLPAFLILAIWVPFALGEIHPDTAKKLQSNDWRQRKAVFDQFAQKKNLSPDEEAALIALLVRENSFARQSSGTPDDPSDHDDGEFVNYSGSLTNTVLGIAEKNPDRPDVWPALLGSGYGAPSALTSFFAAHADKTASFLLAAANGKVVGLYEPDVTLVALAEIVRYERDSTRNHHLSITEVELIERTIRDPMKASDVLARMGAMEALALIGSADDLRRLDEIAATDPTYDSDSKYYPLRTVARFAAERLRRLLSGDGQ